MSSNPDAINKLQASDPTASQHPQQGTIYTSPTNVEHLELPPSQRWLQNLPKPTLPTKTQPLQGPPIPRVDPPAAPRPRIRISARDRRQTQYRHKPRPRHVHDEPFEPLDPYRLTISPIAAVRSFFKQISDWAMQGLPNRDGRAPQEVGNELEKGIQSQPEAPISAETEEQPRGNLSDRTTHIPAHFTSLPNIPVAHQEKKVVFRPSSKTSGKGDSGRKEKNANSKPSPKRPPPEAYTSPKPASEPAPLHTPSLSPPHLASQLPAHPDNIKHQPPPNFWKEIIRQIYRYLLLRLPSLYSNRVGRVFQEARVSKLDLELLISRATATHAVVVAGVVALGVGGSDIPTSHGRKEGRRWILDSIAGTPRPPHGTPRNLNEREGMTEGSAGNKYGTVEYGASPSPMLTPLGPLRPEASQVTLADSVPPDEQWTVPHVPWSLARFKEEWETFVIRLINEWKTLNILSALLLAWVWYIFCCSSQLMIYSVR